MSGQRRPREQPLYDYNEADHPHTDATFHDPPAPPLLAQLPRAQHPHGVPIPAPAPYSTSFIPYLSRHTQPRDNPSISHALYPLPIVTSHSSLNGSHGSQIRIHIKASYEISAPPALYIFIMFGHVRRQAFVKREHSDAQFHHYSLESEIPAFDPGQHRDASQVPLVLQFQDDYGNNLGTVEVGDFTYLDDTAYGHESYNSLANRKRKQSTEPSESIRSLPKRTTNQHLMNRLKMPPVSDQHFASSQPPSYLHSGSSVPYGIQQEIPLHHAYSSARAANPPMHHATGLFATSQHLSSSALTSPMHGPASRSSSLSGATGPSTMTIGYPSSTSFSAPTLVRTSSVTPSAVPMPSPAASASTFNPYAMYPNSKAELKLDGDLDGLVDGWTQDEWSQKRRLVQFQRTQSGSTITATFKPISLEERTPGSICISCILWEERNECFVTSVDTIYLLESLVAVKFTVEEKNRIRRNLEGFRPLTVSKAKADREEFFKVVMGFPNPKPRNIEKDVKVFPWKILSHALKKIIGKYSASYASTASALSTPSVSGHARRARNLSHDISEPSMERHALESPVSASSSGTSTFQDGSIMTTTARSQGWSTATHTTTADVHTSPAFPTSGQSRHQSYIGPGMSPALSNTLPADWTAHQDASQYAGLESNRQVSDMSAYMVDGNPAMSATPRPAQGLLQYYRTYPQTMSGNGQDPSQNFGGDPYDLYGGHAAAPHEMNQQTTNI